MVFPDLTTDNTSKELKKVLSSTNIYKGTYRICLIGTTGSGKTSFLKMLLNDYFTPFADVRRSHFEEETIDSTYTIIDKKLVVEESTTTVSFNITDVLMVITKHNTIGFFPLYEAKEVIKRDDIENIWHVLWIDTAGQERFDFIPQTMVKSSDGIILFADGTNIESVVKLTMYIDLIRKEEKESSREIPFIVCLNKKDLEKNNVYLGMSVVDGMVDLDVSRELIYETSVLEKVGFNESIRQLIYSLKEERKIAQRLLD